MNRAVALFFAVASVVASVAGCSQPVATGDRPIRANTPPVEASSDEARAAIEKLRTAESFESAHIGYAGVVSDYVRAFRTVLAQPRAAELFRELFATSTMAGRLYALCGLYFVDPSAFAAGTADLAANHGAVATMNGCIRGDETVADVVRSSREDRMRIAKGQTLDDWFASHRPGAGDIAGGYTPLSFLETPRPAPRDPL
jgi:hypothetical protein